MFTFQQNYTRRKLQKSVTVTATRLTPTTQSAYRPRGSDSLVVTRQANVWRWQQQILILTTCPSSSTQNTFRGRCRQAHHFQGNSFYVFHTTGSQTVLYTTSVNSILNQPKKKIRHSQLDIFMHYYNYVGMLLDIFGNCELV